MSALVSRRPLLLALLGGVPVTALAAPETQEGMAARSIDLTSNTSGQELLVRISPNRTTSLVFDTPLSPGGVRVEHRECFRSVTVDEAAGLVTLLPSGELTVEEPLSLTVRFADDAIPESVIFQLVPHTTGAEPQVQVFRQARSADSYKQEARMERERAERCAAELERTRAEQRSPGGLVGLLELGLMGKGKVIAVRDTFKSIPQRPDSPFQVRSAPPVKTWPFHGAPATGRSWGRLVYWVPWFFPSSGEDWNIQLTFAVRCAGRRIKCWLDPCRLRWCAAAPQHLKLPDAPSLFFPPPGISSNQEGP